MTLHVVGESYDHMSRISGLQCLSDELLRLRPDARIISTNLVPQVFRSAFTIVELAKKVTKSNVLPLGPGPFLSKKHEKLAFHLLCLLQRDNHASFLLLASENQLGSYLSRSSSFLSRASCLFHQPPSWLKLYWKDFSIFDKLNRIIVLSDDQKIFFQSVTSTPILKIKHGVCHSFFTPAKPSSQNRNYFSLLFVGQWLRDFSTLDKSYTLLQAQCPKVKLTCVIPRFARDNSSLLSLARHQSVEFFSDITPHQLLKLYQDSDLLFLPLLDCTANNAIVEAMACGVPIVSSNVGGIRDYLSSEVSDLLSPGDEIAHANAAIRWLNDPAKRLIASKKIRQSAVTCLGWDHIAQEILDFIA